MKKQMMSNEVSLVKDPYAFETTLNRPRFLNRTEQSRNLNLKGFRFLFDLVRLREIQKVRSLNRLPWCGINPVSQDKINSGNETGKTI